jgi:diadenosine tetraphosphate (Ap4A) HIT family hydrolase
MDSQEEPAGWTLDPRIEVDTVAIGDLALCRLRLMNDASYPWVLLVPRRTGAVEIAELDADDRTQLMDEIVAVSRALKTITGCDKINVASLGNVVPQLHVHVIARSQGDAAWPKAVWGAVPARPYTAAGAQALAAALRKHLMLG